jgi:hypothetical protein
MQTKDQCMTPEQVKLVQDSLAKLAPNADKAAELFYDRLFNIVPDVRPLFPDELSEQRQKLMQMLAIAVTNVHQGRKDHTRRPRTRPPARWLRGNARALRAADRRAVAAANSAAALFITSAMVALVAVQASLWDLVGYLAAALVLAAFWMREMVPLRIAALCSNLAFITYGLGLDLAPVWLLHALLLPMNGYRLLEALRSRRIPSDC